MADQSDVRHLVLVLGDQLDAGSAAIDGFDPSIDAVWMAEVSEEAEHVRSHKARIALFLSAMRHFRRSLERRGITVHYRSLDDPDNKGSFAAELVESVRSLRPGKLVVVQPGEWRVLRSLQDAATDCGIELEIRPDGHFICSRDEFDQHAEGRKQLRLEYFYRELRRKHDVLVEDGRPAGGTWNYDHDNRRTFGREGPGDVPPPIGFAPDEITRNVIELVEERFADHPGQLDRFDWPVTSEQASEALQDFVEHRLALFGPYEDAMWAGRPVLYHSRLSSSVNLKLLDPRDAIAAAQEAYDEGAAPLNSVEGVVRQFLGWREFIRGIYWRFMPDYAERNALGADRPLPWFYWTGETEMNCLREVIDQTLELGFAHHIQRLMVTGLFAMLLSVDPRAVHRWYLAIYVDAVEWVELPNVLGMSQFADGGLFSTKPYAASGKYINRMSNYCRDCRYDPSESTGDDACPFTTLYWDFLMRHEKTLGANPRMALQVRNLQRYNRQDRNAIRTRADAVRAAILS